jgi:hypothetical protein
MTLFTSEAAPLFFLIWTTAQSTRRHVRASKNRGKTGEAHQVWSLRAEDLNVDLVGGSVVRPPQAGALSGMLMLVGMYIEKSLFMLAACLDVLARRTCRYPWMAAGTEHGCCGLKKVSRQDWVWTEGRVWFSQRWRLVVDVGLVGR